MRISSTLPVAWSWQQNSTNRQLQFVEKAPLVTRNIIVGAKAANKMAFRREYHQHGRISLGKNAFIREGPAELSEPIPHLGLRYFPLASTGLWSLLGVITDSHQSAAMLSEMRLPHLVLIASLSFHRLLCAYRIVIDQTNLLLY